MRSLARQLQFDARTLLAPRDNHSTAYEPVLTTLLVTEVEQAGALRPLFDAAM